jgi:hypothetical protein
MHLLRLLNDDGANGGKNLEESIFKNYSRHSTGLTYITNPKYTKR